MAHLAREDERPPDGPSTLDRSVGLETLGGVFTPLIKKCTELPVRVEETFSTASDNQTSVEVTMLSGDQPMARDNQLLGRISLEHIRPAPRGVPQIRVAFSVDAGGGLRATARDLSTSHAQTVAVQVQSP